MRVHFEYINHRAILKGSAIIEVLNGTQTIYWGAFLKDVLLL